MKVLVVDFWSDGNLGDAIMQKEILHQCSQHSAEVHVVSCFGSNQFQLNAFFESLSFENVTWHPAAFSTYLSLDEYHEDRRGRRIPRLILTLLALLICEVRVLLCQALGTSRFLGWRRLRRVQFDAVILNGRNYRDFGNTLKNYINNRPLVLHQKLAHLLFKDVPVLNAGMSVWSLDRLTKRVAQALWPTYARNAAREGVSYRRLRQELSLTNLTQEKDLSFPYLARCTAPPKVRDNLVAFSLTQVKEEDRYLRELNLLLERLSAAGSKLCLVRQVYLAHESTTALERAIRPKHEIFSSKFIDRTVAFYASCRAVVSTRMHGSIIALSRGVPTASIAYDDGAKWSIITDEIPDYPIFRPDDFSAESMWNYLMSDAAERHAKLFQEIVRRNSHEYVEAFLRHIGSEPK